MGGGSWTSHGAEGEVHAGEFEVSLSTALLHPRIPWDLDEGMRSHGKAPPAVSPPPRSRADNKAYAFDKSRHVGERVTCGHLPRGRDR